MQERQLFLMDEFGRMEVCLPLMIILVRYGSMVILVWSDSLSWSSVVEAGLDLWSLYKETYDLFLDNQPSVWFVCLHSSNLVYNKSDLDPLVILQNWNIMCGWAGFAGFCNFNLLFKLNTFKKKSLPTLVILSFCRYPFGRTIICNLKPVGVSDFFSL